MQLYCILWNKINNYDAKIIQYIMNVWQLKSKRDTLKYISQFSYNTNNLCSSQELGAKMTSAKINAQRMQKIVV